MGVTLVRRTGAAVDAIDLFCGFGGSSQGIHAAGADIRVAANHSELAIDCHARNFPNVDHCRADISNPSDPFIIDRKGKKVPGSYMDPADLPPARFVWASPSCRHQSRANATKQYALGPRLFVDEDFDQERYANSERSRVSMTSVLRYARKHHPELVVVENVVEAAQWGPDRDGSTFQWWLREWVTLGYDFEALFLNSQFFPPCPQSRDRMYVVFWRKGNVRPDLNYHPTAYCTSDRCSGKIVAAVQSWKERTAAWPMARWGKYGGQYIYTCPDCRRRVEPVAWPAYTAINWDDLGDRLGDRERPLADSTIERIRRGLMKFRNGPPIIIPAKAAWGTDRPVTWPLSTQDTQQAKALVVEGGIIPLRTNGTPADLLDQLRTVVAGNVGQALIVKNYGSIGEAKYRAQSVGEALGSITSADSQALVTEGIVVPRNGNVSERPGQTRARSLADPLFAQHATMAFGFAHLPFLTEMRGGGSVQAGQHPVSDPAQVSDPAHAITAGGLHHMLVSPGMFSKINGGPGDTAWHLIDDPLNTITGRDTHGLVILPWVEQWRSDPVAVTEQLATVMTHLRHALASVEPDMLPVTDEDLLNVRFRMLEPDPELRRGMAFADEYILIGNKTEMTSGLGNAVTPPVASWITERCLATLSDDPRRMSA